MITILSHKEKLLIGSSLIGKLIHQGTMKLMPVEEQKTIIGIMYKVGVFSYARYKRALLYLENKDYQNWVAYLKQIPDVTSLIEERDS